MIVGDYPPYMYIYIYMYIYVTSRFSRKAQTTDLESGQVLTLQLKGQKGLLGKQYKLGLLTTVHPLKRWGGFRSPLADGCSAIGLAQLSHKWLVAECEDRFQLLRPSSICTRPAATATNAMHCTYL